MSHIVSAYRAFSRGKVTSNLFKKNNSPLYRDMGIEKGIKITIPTCPAAQLKLLGCYMLLFAISCPVQGTLIMKLSLV